VNFISANGLTVVAAVVVTAAVVVVALVVVVVLVVVTAGFDVLHAVKTKIVKITGKNFFIILPPYSNYKPYGGNLSITQCSQIITDRLNPE
jgi:hypothetical protein